MGSTVTFNGKFVASPGLRAAKIIILIVLANHNKRKQSMDQSQREAPFPKRGKSLSCLKEKVARNVQNNYRAHYSKKEGIVYLFKVMNF